MGVGALVLLAMLVGLATYFEAMPQSFFTIGQSTIGVETREAKQHLNNINSQHEEVNVTPTRIIRASNSSKPKTATAPGAILELPTETVVATLNESRTITDGETATYATDRKVLPWIGVGAMNTMIARYWRGNLFCEEIEAIRQNNSKLPITVNVSFGCQELYSNSGLGSGNFLSALYHMRMSALAMEDVDLHVTCPDADAVKTKLVLPWFMGHYWSEPNSQQRLGKTVAETCGSYDTSPISYMYERMKYALRRMAIGLVGVPGPDHPAAKFAEEYLWSSENNNVRSVVDSDLQLPVPRKDDIPPFPPESFSLDDATIHFRCGDLMALNHPSFGFMKFSGYTKYISKDARSIGILTQPFHLDGQGRKADQGERKRDRCRIVVTSLVEYIQERFPNTRVTVHNGPNETIALAYARMIMANETVVGISSFGVFAAVGTFGTGYIRKPDFPKAPNKFLIQPRLDEIADNVVLIDEPNRIMCGTIAKLWQTGGAEGVLKWFWNDAVKA